MQTLLHLNADGDGLYDEVCVCKFEFGSYVQVPSETDQSSSQEAQTLDCIYVRALEETHEGHEVYDLHTKQIITRRGNINVLPITDVIIRAVEDIAAADKQTGFRHRMASQHIPYDPAWTAGVDYEEDAHDDTYQDEDESDDKSDSEWLKVEVEDDDPNEIQEYPVQTGLDHQEQDQVDEDEVEVQQEDEPVDEFEQVEVEDVTEIEDDPNEQEEPGQHGRTSRYGRTMRQPTMFEPRVVQQPSRLAGTQSKTSFRVAFE